MIGSAKMRSPARIAAMSVALAISLSACGSDSTGPSNLDANGALQSLMLGMNAIGSVQTPGTPPTTGSFGDIGPLLDHINVTVDGSAHSMFALGLRESFPAGTCMENVFVDPNLPPAPGVCTPPDLGLAVLLWQSHSASAPPDRLIFLIADAGTTDFDLGSNFYDINLTQPPIPGVAIYMESVNDLWMSLSGALTSQVAATSQACGLPLPPYAKSASCNVATFDEEGTITFEEFSETGTSTRRKVVAIPRQTIHGLWQSITETQPVSGPGPWDYTRVLGRLSPYASSAMNSAR